MSYDAIRPDLRDELLVDYEKPEDLLGDGGLIKQVKTALVARELGAELIDHLGMRRMTRPSAASTGYSRNGYSNKTVLTEETRSTRRAA